jgi:hypothetical protein
MVNDIKIMIAKALANKLNEVVFVHTILVDEYTLTVDPKNNLSVCFDYANKAYVFKQCLIYGTSSIVKL